MRRRLWRIIHDRAGYTGLPLAFKGLMILGIVVIAGFLVYTTQKMVGELKASEARLANAYASQWKRAAESTDPGEIGYLQPSVLQPAVEGSNEDDSSEYRVSPGLRKQVPEARTQVEDEVILWRKHNVL